MKYQCRVCGHIYDEEEGEAEYDIPGTKWEDLNDWVCPVCGTKKNDFERLE
jgi:rubredoxin